MPLDHMVTQLDFFAFVVRRLGVTVETHRWSVLVEPASGRA